MTATKSNSPQTQSGGKPALAPLRPDRDEDGYSMNHPPARLAPLAAEPQPQLLPAGQTETLLNNLIAECGMLLRDVAFRSACATPDGAERIRFLAEAENLVLTGAAVGETIARLRGAAEPVESHRHEIVYTHRQKVLPAGAQTESDDVQ